MAINPETQYPGKVTPSTPDYPYGAARNITTPGDGTGTPWEAALVNDLFGFQQALLTAGGVVPSGTPEKATASQYLEALLKVTGRQVALTTDILTTNLAGTTNLVTFGRTAANDGGGAKWTATGITTPGNAGTEDRTNRVIYDSVGTEFKYNETPINPAAFGILPSAADNATAWQELLQSNPAHVHYSIPGTYTFLSSADHDTDIAITSVPGVIIDCTGGGFVGDYWTRFAGELPQIENLGVNAVKGERSVTFASPPSLQPGDVFVIFNPSSSSWSTFRSNYYAGEFCEVVSVAGSGVTVAGELYDDYDFTAVNVYRLDGIRVALGGLTVNGDLSASLVNLEHCRDSYINEIKSNHKNNSCVSLLRCYNTIMDNPTVHNEGDGGNDYGIAVSNSQTIKIFGGNVYSRRHAVTTGGDAQPGAVPCRDLRFIGMTLSNDINSGAHCADFHGNTEDSQYIDCEIYGGATWQGKDNGYVNCRIGNLLAGPCILSAEILGGEHYAINCRFHSVIDPFATTRGLIDVGGNSSVVDSRTAEDATFRVKGGKAFGRNFSAPVSFLLMNNRGSNNKINIEVSGIEFDFDNLQQVVLTRFTAGTADSDFMIVDELTSVNGLGALLVNHGDGGAYSSFPHRLQKQSGQETLTTSTGASIVSGTPVSYKWSYPRNPNLLTSRSNRAYAGNRIGIAFGDSVSYAGFTPYIATDDATNFASATTIDFNWLASIDEV